MQERLTNAAYPTRQLVNLEKGRELLGGISIWTLRAWVSQGRIASVKLGSRVMLDVAEIDRLIDEGTRPALEK